MRGRRSGRGPDRSEPASPLAQLRAVTEAAEEALLRTETAVARVSRAEEREHLRQARDSLSHSLQVILGTMIGSAEAAGPGREGHSRRVASITRDLTDALGWPPMRVRGMELAGLFLDIGMLALPSDLLAPRGPLEPAAVELLQGHADISGDILEPLARVGLPVAAVRAHHERLDGSGYPRGLRGRQVPFGAQILGRGGHLGRPDPAPAPPPGHVRAGGAGRAAPAGRPRPPARQAGRRPRAGGALGAAGRRRPRAGSSRAAAASSRVASPTTRTTRRHGWDGA